MDCLDLKIPDVFVVRIPKFRAMTTGPVDWDEVFDSGIDTKQAGLTVPILFDGADFLYGKNGKAYWLWRIKDDVTAEDTHPFEITEFEGGLYAVAVSIDGDGDSHDKVRAKMAGWLKTTGFIMDNDREMLGHMIYVDDEVKKGLGYEQMALYAPIKFRDESAPSRGSNEIDR